MQSRVSYEQIRNYQSRVWYEQARNHAVQSVVWAGP